jgi:hypothetical protein
MTSLERVLIATGAEAALGKLHAGITSLHLLGLAGTMERMADLAARPELSGITELTLAGTAPDRQNRPPPVAALATLASAPALGGVRKLTLDKNVLDDQGAIALASAPWLATVEELCIIDNPALGADGIAALLAQLPAVWSLYVARSNVGVAGAHAIASSRMPLRALVLTECSLKDEGARVLFGAAFVESVTRISISRDFLKDALGRLAIRPAAALEQLELQRCGLEDAGTVDFARGLAHGALGDVDLSNNLLGDDVALAFAASTGFPVLEKLDLRRNGIGPNGATALGSTAAMPRLALLGLTENELTTGNTRVHEWQGGMWEAGSAVVHEKLSAGQIEERFVKRRGLGVF